MRTSTAIEHYGSQAALARALGVKQPSVAGWGEKVPWRRQLELERLTRGVLRHDPADIPEDMRAFLRMPAKRRAAA